jgi:hypothetical protein
VRCGEPDGFRCCSAVHIHPHAGVLLGLLIPADEYRRLVLQFSFVVFIPRDSAEAQVVGLEHPLRIEVMRHRLLAHRPLQQPVAGKMVEQR